MKVLFLDIDGVLNRNQTRERCNGFIGVDRKLCQLLLDWLAVRDVKIVLSSTWRLHKDMWDHLREAGLDWIDITPDSARKSAKSPVWCAKTRGDEIREWLEAHPEVTAYAILDDDADMLPDQMPFFVQTHNPVGLRHCDIMRLTEILG